MLHCAEDAEEIANDAYLQLWNTIPPANPDSLKGYLGKLCKHLAINRLEKETAEKRGGGQLPLVLEELRECVDGADSDLADAIAFREAINRFLRGLPRKKRTVFIQRYWYFCSVAEIARDAHMKEGSVAVLLLRLRKALAAHLEKEGFTL